MPNQQQDFCVTTLKYDVPCVCATLLKKTTELMIPAKVTYPSSWTRVCYG